VLRCHRSPMIQDERSRPYFRFEEMSVTLPPAREAVGSNREIASVAIVASATSPATSPS
jgi:hypothetical protein